MRNLYKISAEKPEKERAHSEDLALGVRIILKWILRKLGGKAWIGFIRPRPGAGGRLKQTW